MAPSRCVPSNLAAYDDPHEYVSGIAKGEHRSEHSVTTCYEANKSSNDRDPTGSSLVSYRGTPKIGTKHARSNTVDLSAEEAKDEKSKKRKSKKVAKKTTKTAVNNSSSVWAVDTADRMDFKMKANAVLTVLVGRYFNAPEDQAHLGEALRAVITAAGGSLETIQFFTEICQAADSQFVAETAFQSQYLTPSVTRWIINKTEQQNDASALFVNLLRKFVCGGAPLAAGHLLLHHVDDNATYVVHDQGKSLPVWKICMAESPKVWVNSSRLLLVLGKVNLSLQEDPGLSPLHYTAIHNHLEATEFLVNQRNLDVNAQDRDGETVLMRALAEGNTDVAKFLAMSPFANLELQDDDGFNALHYTALLDVLDFAKFLVNELNMDVNLQNRYCHSALMVAIIQGHTEVTKFLALHPLTNLELQDEDGWDARQLAANLNQPEVTEILENRQNGQNGPVD